MQFEHKRVTRWVAGTSLLASTAIIISLLRLRIPYPLLPFLSFDLAEIPSVLALLVLDFKSASTVALIHWLTLNLGRPFHAIIGPLMKLIAVISMLIGFRLVLSRSREVTKNKIVAMTMLGSLTRVGIMSLVTFLIYYVLFPETYLPTSEKILKNIFGLEVGSEITIALIIVVLTAFFNLLHVPLSLIPASSVYFVYKKIFR
ncbi:MAG: hypothetical protein NZ929_03475 [Aigarchaeota archaeon]|nr:hypothetical protein [Aigarchaeota archaeon]MDW7986955.1 hypothetical protein [Nitrososphaerota archaeon]